MATQVHDSEISIGTAHPLEPLTAEEVSRVSALLRDERDLGPSVRFVSVALHEPPKREVLDYTPDGETLDREAFVILYDRTHQQTVEAVVSLSSSTVTSWQVVEGVQPSVMLEEFFSTEEITRADPRWQEAMRKRGVT
ncbi:MAG: tyramine oxidase, partial [Actinomycetota bacterium]|nr:tyramine oxidase [Actinomycetota bacterium]